MDSYTIIRRPVVSEKSHRIINEKVGDARLNQYTFEVDSRATKPQIKAAVEKIFEVRVVKVNTMHVGGKLKRVGAAPQGRTRSWKKAVVTLDQDSTIQVY